MREFYITTAELKANAKALFDKGMLTAQSPGNPACANIDGDGRKCAIAASYPDYVLSYCPGGGIAIVVAVMRGELTSYRGDVPEDLRVNIIFEDFTFAHAFQHAHDRWARRSAKRTGDTTAQRDFIAMMEG